MEAGYQQLLASKPAFVITPQLRSPDLPKDHAYTLKPGHPTPGPPNFLRPPIALQNGTGILTRFPSTTALALVLGADSPCADERCAGILGLTARGLFTPFIATHVSIRTSDISSILYKTPSQTYGTLSYHLCVPLTLLTTCCTLRLDRMGALCRVFRKRTADS